MSERVIAEASSGLGLATESYVTEQGEKVRASQPTIPKAPHPVVSLPQAIVTVRDPLNFPSR